MEDYYPDNGPDYLHGGNQHSCFSSGGEHQNITREGKKVTKTKSVANIAANGGSIPCLPTKLGGCGRQGLEQRRLFQEDWLTRLEAEATTFKLFLPSADVAGADDACSCCLSGEKRIAASRENSVDNWLYYPVSDAAKPDDLKHFQKHWVRGESVVLRGILDKMLGLSWEPWTMWSQKHDDRGASDLVNVKAFDCLSCCEVSSILLLLTLDLYDILLPPII